MINVVDEFFNTDDFSQTATYTDPSGVPTEIPVIFNAPFHIAVVGDIQYMSKEPSVICRSIDVADADTTTEIIIDSVTYKVIEVQPDGTGITTLILSLN